MPLRRKDVRAAVMADFSSESRVEVQSSLARQTWVMEERERFEARRCGISVSRGEDVVPAVGSGEGDGGCREEVEEAMVDEGGDVWLCWRAVVSICFLHARFVGG